jgi:hypothetical protein
MSEGEFCLYQFNTPLMGCCEPCNELLGSVHNKELVGQLFQNFNAFRSVSYTDNSVSCIII